MILIKPCNNCGKLIEVSNHWADQDVICECDERMKYTDIPKKIRDEMDIDEFIFGNSFCLKKEDGKFERIDPIKVKLNPTTKEFEIIGD